MGDIFRFPRSVFQKLFDNEKRLQIKSPLQVMPKSFQLSVTASIHNLYLTEKIDHFLIYIYYVSKKGLITA